MPPAFLETRYLTHGKAEFFNPFEPNTIDRTRIGYFLARISVLHHTLSATPTNPTPSASYAGTCHCSVGKATQK